MRRNQAPDRVGRARRPRMDQRAECTRVLRSVDAIADGSGEFWKAKRDTIVVANAGDARVMARALIAGAHVTFGVEVPADVRATDVVDAGILGMTPPS